MLQHKMLNIAAICWLTHEVRTALYARYLSARLYNIHYISNRHPIFAPFKYVPQCIKTWLVLCRQRPDIVYVMNPPIFAAISVYLYASVARIPFIMDTHTPSLYGNRWRWSLPLQKAMAMRALVNIIDQERFRVQLESWGARGIVLERPPMMLKSTTGKVNGCGDQVVNGPPLHSADKFHIVVIGTFAADEPVDIVVTAAKGMRSVQFSILGDMAIAPRSVIKAAPPNVYFTGYLTGDSYWRTLQSADAIMVLTTFEYSLLGGAQEGMALGKPLILSNQPALTDYFSQGTVFVEHTVESIRKGIIFVITHHADLSQDVALMAVKKRVAWERNFEVLKKIICEGVNR